MRLTLKEKKAVKMMTEHYLDLVKKERCRDADKKKRKQQLVKLLESIINKTKKDIEEETKDEVSK